MQQYFCFDPSWLERKNITCQDANGGKNFQIGWVLSGPSLIKRPPALYYFHSIGSDRFLRERNDTKPDSEAGCKSRGYGNICRSFFPERVLVYCVYIFVGHLFLDAVSKLFPKKEARVSNIISGRFFRSQRKLALVPRFNGDTQQSWRLFSPLTG